MKIAIVTGCSGLIGSQSVKFLTNKGFLVVGIDNHMRGYFFGEESSTKDITEQLLIDYPLFIFEYCDIRDYSKLEPIFKKYKKDTLSDNLKIDNFINSLPTFSWSISANLIIPATFIFLFFSV